MLSCSHINLSWRPVLLLLLLVVSFTSGKALAPIQYGDADGRFPGLPPLTAVKPGSEGTYTITLTEQLGQTYDNEIVHYRLDGLTPTDTGAWTLKDERGHAIPFQLDTTPRAPEAAHLWFRIERLEPQKTQVFRLSKNPSTQQSPWQIVTGDTHIECTNGITGVRVPKSIRYDPPVECEQAPGPILGIRGISGRWIGSSLLRGAGKITGIDSAVTAGGPIRTVLSVRYAFEAPDQWYQLDLELFAGMNYARLVEQGKFPNPDGRLILKLDDWQPNRGIRQNLFSTQVLHDRFGDKAVSQAALISLRPFIGGGWYGLYKEGGQDFMSIVPSMGGYWTPGYSVMLTSPEKGYPQLESWLNVDFHAFFLVMSDAGQAIRNSTMPGDFKPTRTEKPSEVKQTLTRRSPYGIIYFISSYNAQLLAGSCDPWYYRLTLNDLPLDKVKDWVLTHDDDGVTWPRLFGTKAEWPRMRRQTVPLLEEWQHRQKYLPIDYIVSGKPQSFGDRDYVRDHWEQTWRVDLTTQAVFNRGFAASPYILTLGQAMHGGVRMTDTFQESLTPAQWVEWKKWALAGGYILRDREYWWYNWQPGYATRYLPNFNTCQWASLGLLSLLLPNHPQAQEWRSFARDGLEKEFEHHIDEQGVGQENIGNYFPFACNLFYPFISAMQRHQVADYTTHPRFKATVSYLINVLTPPDPRAKGARILPRIGHHPGAGAITTDLCGWAAKMLQKTDPQLSAYAQWAWKQQGGKLAFSHDFPLGLYLADPELPAECPPLGSRVMGSMGFIFRNRFPGTDETYFAIKSGPISSHFQDDEGAFSFYAHGVPLAVDGLDLSSSDDRAINHNVLTFNGAGGGRGKVQAFATTSLADYGIAELTGARGYLRHILLVKGKDATEPDYLVLYDKVISDQPPQWNLDVHSEKPELVGNAEAGQLAGVSFPGIRQPGYGVGLDCFFVTLDKPAITVAKGNIEQNYLGHLGVKEHWHARVAAPAKTDFCTVLLPFINTTKAAAPEPDKEEEPPVAASPHATVRRLNDRRAIEITHASGRDIVLLSPESFTFQDGKLKFDGRAGVVRLLGDTVSLALLDGTALSYGSVSVKGPKPAAVDRRK
ncbi:MAG: heparinase II/III family protein [Armatimonadota bacterium]